MDKKAQLDLATKLDHFVCGEVDCYELKSWLDSGEAWHLAEQLPPRERLYYSWMRQSLDDGIENDNDQKLRNEVAFFIRILNGQVSWFERCRRWWRFS